MKATKNFKRAKAFPTLRSKDERESRQVKNDGSRHGEGLRGGGAALRPDARSTPGRRRTSLPRIQGEDLEGLRSEGFSSRCLLSGQFQMARNHLRDEIQRR